MAPERSLGRLIFSFQWLIFGRSAFLRAEIEASNKVCQFALDLSLDIVQSLHLVGVTPNHQQQLLLGKNSVFFFDFEVRQELKTPRGEAKEKHEDEIARLLVTFIIRS